MFKKLSPLFSLLVVLFLFSCGKKDYIIDYNTKQKITIEDILRCPERQLRNFNFKKQDDFISRIEVPPGFMKDYLYTMDRKKYSNYMPDREEQIFDH